MPATLLPRISDASDCLNICPCVHCDRPRVGALRSSAKQNIELLQQTARNTADPLPCQAVVSRAPHAHELVVPDGQGSERQDRPEPRFRGRCGRRRVWQLRLENGYQRAP